MQVMSLLDVSSMKLWTHFLLLVLFRVDVAWAYVALLASSLLEKALNVTVVILYLILPLTDFLCRDPTLSIWLHCEKE